MSILRNSYVVLLDLRNSLVPCGSMSLSLKPIFHLKMGLRWVPDANEIYTNHMKCTCPTQRPNARDPMQPIFHWGFASGQTQIYLFLHRDKHKFNFLRFFIYQHVGILALGDAKVLSFALGDAKLPDASSFAIWWNIGFKSQFPF